MMGMFSISQNIKTVYCGSLFIGLCDSSDLVQHFIDFSKKMKWDNSYLLQLGMNLSEMLHNEMNKSFIYVGTCPLHIVHNSFQKDITTFDFNFDEFFCYIHVFFSSGRREDFKDMENITNISVMAKHERCRCKNNQSMVSSIDIEIIRTVFFCFFLLKYFAQKKKTHKLYSNILIHLKKHNKQHKQLSFRCKVMNFLLKYRLEKI